MKLKYNILLIFSILAMSNACRKPSEDPIVTYPGGVGGHAEIAAFPKHHGKPIPGARVFIKYGAKEFPGTDTTKYDAKGTAETDPGFDPHVHFENLKPGYYYFYSVGFDTGINQKVTGGIPYQLKKDSVSIDLEVPVTE